MWNSCETARGGARAEFLACPYRDMFAYTLSNLSSWYVFMLIARCVSVLLNVTRASITAASNWSIFMSHMNAVRLAAQILRWYCDWCQISYGPAALFGKRTWKNVSLLLGNLPEPVEISLYPHAIFFEAPFFNISLYLRLNIQTSPFQSGFPAQIVCAFLIPHACCICHQSPLRLVHPINIRAPFFYYFLSL